MESGDQTAFEAVRKLFAEYAETLGIDLAFQNFSQELAELPGKFAPPHGCLLLVLVDGQPAGCVALRPSSDGICEMKRMYVRPAYRQGGLGRALAEQIILAAQRRGYRRMRLDTISPLMDKALALYRSLGFVNVPPYCENPYPGAQFLELSLDTPASSQANDSGRLNTPRS